MATNHKGGPGRRGKGPRHAFLTRVRKALAEEVIEEADARDVTHSDFLWKMTEFVYGNPELREQFLKQLPPRVNNVQVALEYPEGADLQASA